LRRGALAPLAALVTAILTAHPAAGSPPPCLSISPFRASGSSDSATVQSQRKRLLDSLRTQLGEDWKVEPAGKCPPGSAILDLFQRPGDFIETPGNSLLRVRLEWRHSPGPTLVTLEPQGRTGGDVSLWSRTLSITARQQMQVPLQISTDGPVSQVSGSLEGKTPLSALLPPGPFRTVLKAPGYASVAIDTQLVLGTPLQLQARMVRLPGSSVPAVTKPSSMPRWVAYGLSAASLAGSLYFHFQQTSAQDSYRALGQDAPASSFQNRWNDVHQANLWRNTLAVSGVSCLGIGVVLHLREASFLP